MRRKLAALLVMCSLTAAAAARAAPAAGGRDAGAGANPSAGAGANPDALGKLFELGALRRAEGGFRVTTAWWPAVVRYLRRKHLIET